MILRRLLHTRASSIRAHTLYSPNVQLLEQHLASVPSSSVTAYLLSTSIPSSALQPLIKTLQSLPSVGSFSISSPGSEPSLSIATFERGRLFRSDLSGRPPVQVGRYQRPGVSRPDTRGSEIGDTESVKNEQGWAGLWKGEAETTRIPELEGTRAKSFLLLTDHLPTPILQGINTMFPGASTMGILTAPTPFLTGRQHTLLHNNEIFSSGTVGIALEDIFTMETEFGLEPLTGEHSVSGAQGNLLLRIDGHANPTQTLMTAIQQRDAGKLGDKEEAFFLRIGEKMVRILSGDPSRGALSLDMEDPLLEGQRVQFMYRRQKHSLGLQPGVQLGALQRSDDEEISVPLGKPRIENGFLGTSEDGFIHGNAVCTVPGGRVSWS